MTTPRHVLVTGAGGFLGRQVVTAALAAGHEVTALVRRTSPAGAANFDPAVHVVVGDLRSSGPWMQVLDRIDVVAHTAAAPGGPRPAQLANTVVATERLIHALEGVPLKRFVHISSFSVYDYHALTPRQLLDERSPLETNPARRDAYTEAKLIQERLVRDWCVAHEIPCVVVRPAAIVGPGKAWNHGAALTVGRFAVVASPHSYFPLVSLANCADAIVKAIDVDTPGIETVNIVDDELPTYAEYFRRCRQAGATDLHYVPVPWRALYGIGRTLAIVSTRWLDGRLRTPEILDLPRQEARWKPLRYSNSRAHALLGWRSEQSLAATIAQAVGDFTDGDRRDGGGG